MKKPVRSQGSAEQVVAHAAWQRSRGRNPSMFFLGQRNPRKALALACSVIRTITQTELLNTLGAIVMSYKSYHNMTDLEIEAAARHIVNSSSSEDEAQQRLRDELGYPYGDIQLCTTMPKDATGREARELVRGLGGLVMKNGALAMAILEGHERTIFI